MRQVEAGLGHVADDLGEDRQVAGDRRLLGRGRPAAQARGPSRRSPSFASAPAVWDASSACSTIGSPSAPAYASAFRMSAATDATGAPSSLEADDARVGELAERRERLAGPTGRDRAPRERPHRRARTPAAAARTRARTAGSSSGGVVFGISADRREPAVGRGRQPGRDRLGVLVAGLAEMDVEVDEARARRRRPWSSIPSASPPSSQVTRLEDAVGHDDLAGTLATRRRIDEPGPRDLEIGDDRPDRARPSAPTATSRRADPGQQVEQRHPDRDAVADLLLDQRLRARRRRPARSRRPRSSGPGA